jgi:hypothetical protein
MSRSCPACDLLALFGQPTSVSYLYIALVSFLALDLFWRSKIKRVHQRSWRHSFLGATPRQRKRNFDDHLNRSGGQFSNFSGQATEAFLVHPLLYLWVAGPGLAAACRTEMGILTETFKHLATYRTNAFFFLDPPSPFHVTDKSQEVMLLATYL